MYPETKVQNSVLLVDTLPGLDHLRKEGFDYVQMSWFQDVILWPRAEHLEGPSEPSTHLFFAEKLYFGTEAPLGPRRHAVVDSVGGALLQPVYSHRLTWQDREQQVERQTLRRWALVNINLSFIRFWNFVQKTSNSSKRTLIDLYSLPYMKHTQNNILQPGNMVLMFTSILCFVMF